MLERSGVHRKVFGRQKCLDALKQIRSANPQSPGDFQYYQQRRHVLTALDFAHVGSLDSGSLGKGLLRYPAARSDGTNRCAEGLCHQRV